MSPLLSVIQVGREMLANHRQQLVFTAAAQLFLASVLLLGEIVGLSGHQASTLRSRTILWYLWVVIPALSLSMLATSHDDRREEIMTETPSKNELVKP